MRPGGGGGILDGRDGGTRPPPGGPEVPMMINEAHISLSGYVAMQPSLGWTRTGVPALKLRVAWTPRRLDRVTGEWTDMSTSFLTVYAYRKLAENAATCLRKGDPIVLRGRVTTRDFEDKNGHQRTALEVDAISFGHDMTRGVSTFQRVRPQTGMTANEFQEAESGTRQGQAAGRDGDLAAMAGQCGRDADDAAFASMAAAAAGPGPDGTRSGDEAARAPAGTVSAGDTEPGDTEPGDPGREMFDEDAVRELAQDAASVAVPF
jgi:single-strand DNA-binding protein